MAKKDLCFLSKLELLHADAMAHHRPLRDIAHDISLTERFDHFKVIHHKAAADILNQCAGLHKPHALVPGN